MVRNNMSLKLLTLGASLCVGALSMGAAQGELLLYEGFDYTAGETLAGKNGGTWDTTRAWATGGSSNGSINNATVVPGLSLSDFPVVGNAVEVVNNNNNGGNYSAYIAGRQLPSTLSVATPSDVYTSFLFEQRQSGSWANESHLSLAGKPFSGGQHMISRPVTLWGGNPHNAAVGADNGTGSASGALVQTNTTYLVISKFSNINGPTFSSNTATMWMLGVSEWDAIKYGTIDETSLDNHSLLKVTHTPNNTFVVTLDNNQYLRLWTATDWGINSRAAFDEIKMGTSLDQVIAPIPEPATFVLLAMGGILLMPRRQNVRN
ncbi:MAG: hypothetical protein HC898_08745 [Phycisphaerales bacterium]|nr:hypothetical protein [Phycisphaerales bacterium]